MPYEILSSQQMAAADRLQIESGTPGLTLMRNAGKAAARLIAERFQQGSALVLCGSGNNGGDGFIVAQHLGQAGWKVRVAALVPVEALKGDAADAARLWHGVVEDFEALEIDPADIVIDAVFGIGFDRELTPPVLTIFQKITHQKNKVVAIDVPSGINGSTGVIDPGVLQADLTITFCRKKLGHVLEPAKSLCGDVVVCDIGVTDHTVAKAGHQAVENNPGLWIGAYPQRVTSAHKYHYGHALILGSSQMTGATRLAAAACARMGAGVTTVLAQGDAGAIYRASLPPHVIIEDMVGGIEPHLADARRNAVLLGPGAGANDAGLPDMIAAACRAGKKIVLDAGALGALAGMPSLGILNRNCILTPHEGEFERLFPGLPGNKLERAKEAAKKVKSIIILKGGDTVIAAPDGRAVININAPPSLATAGTGDVLAGMIMGLLAQGMPEFEAACAAVWVHGECAQHHGACLVASDLETYIGDVIANF
ncbi:MAG: NAD(P)H-hydrate dehydratase [Alphaproteobacteria bacterium]